MNVWITADDLGYSTERDDGILRSFLEGVVNRSSLMVNGASAEQAIVRSVMLRMPVGLHLNITEGTPISPADKVKSLLQPPEGTSLRGKHGFRAALRAGEVDERELLLEIEAQFQRFCKMHPQGQPPQHCDGHQHVHVLPEVASTLASVMTAYGCTETRMPIISPAEILDHVDEARQSFYRTISDQAADVMHIYTAAGCIFPRHFIGYSTMGSDLRVSRLEHILARLRALPRERERAHGEIDTSVFVEWMVHPGFKTRLHRESRAGWCTCGNHSLHAQYCAAAKQWLASDGAVSSSSDLVYSEAAGCGDGMPDEFSMSEDREHEMNILCDPEVLRAVDQLRAALLT